MVMTLTQVLYDHLHAGQEDSLGDNSDLSEVDTIIQKHNGVQASVVQGGLVRDFALEATCVNR